MSLGSSKDIETETPRPGVDQRDFCGKRNKDGKNLNMMEKTITVFACLDYSKRDSKLC